jgi:hypothetical protein
MCASRWLAALRTWVTDNRDDLSLLDITGSLYLDNDGG